MGHLSKRFRVHHLNNVLLFEESIEKVEKEMESEVHDVGFRFHNVALPFCLKFFSSNVWLACLIGSQPSRTSRIISGEGYFGQSMLQSRLSVRAVRG